MDDQITDEDQIEAEEDETMDETVVQVPILHHFYTIAPQRPHKPQDTIAQVD